MTMQQIRMAEVVLSGNMGTCSHCGHKMYKPCKYCPQCGRKFDIAQGGRGLTFMLENEAAWCKHIGICHMCHYILPSHHPKCLR